MSDYDVCNVTNPKRQSQGSLTKTAKNNHQPSGLIYPYF